MHFLQAINSDLSVLMVCNKTGGTIKGDIYKIFLGPFCTFLPHALPTRALFVFVMLPVPASLSFH